MSRDLDYPAFARDLEHLDEWFDTWHPTARAGLVRRVCRWLAPRFPGLILSVRFRRAHGGQFTVNGVKEWWP